VATNFPASLDSLTNPTSSDSLNSPSHSAQHANVNDAVEALQAKVGADSSAATSSLDYKVAQLEAISHGKILQVVSTTKTDTFSASVAAQTFTNVTGLSLTITPLSTSSTILLYGSVNGSFNLSSSLPYSAWRFTRGGSAIGVGDTDGSRSSITAMSVAGGTTYVGQGNAAMLYLDSPATTSATTYAIDALNFDTTTRTIWVNRPAADSNSGTYTRAISTIIALEVAA